MPAIMNMPERREEEQPDGVRVGEVRPRLLAAVEVQPVRGAQEEARLLPLVDHVARRRRHVQRAVLEEDLELVALAVHLARRRRAMPSLRRTSAFAASSSSGRGAPELVGRRRSWRSSGPSRPMWFTASPLTRVHEREPDGRVPDVPVNRAKQRPPLDRASTPRPPCLSHTALLSTGRRGCGSRASPSSPGSSSRDEADAREPLGALPEVQVGHERAHGRAVRAARGASPRGGARRARWARAPRGGARSTCSPCRPRRSRGARSACTFARRREVGHAHAGEVRVRAPSTSSRSGRRTPARPAASRAAREVEREGLSTSPWTCEAPAAGARVALVAAHRAQVLEQVLARRQARSTVGPERRARAAAPPRCRRGRRRRRPGP